MCKSEYNSFVLDISKEMVDSSSAMQLTERKRFMSLR